jgi:DNA (cytosine-5)-methyltransferase 1
LNRYNPAVNLVKTVSDLINQIETLLMPLAKQCSTNKKQAQLIIIDWLSSLSEDRKIKTNPASVTTKKLITLLTANQIISDLDDFQIQLKKNLKKTSCKKEFKFIDLFAGIGGIRSAFEKIGGECVFTSEWDLYAQKSYKENNLDDHDIQGDITKVDENSIPDHDVLLAGFPCQPFSIAGVSKKNALGRAHGFHDETQGTLFFDVCRIIEAKKPKAFLLENVKNLMSHDKGRTFDVIKRSLVELGYHINCKVIDGAHFVPQHRERIVIVGFKRDVGFSFEKIPLPPKGIKKIESILHKTDGSEPFLKWDGNKYFDHNTSQVLEKYTLSDKLWTYLKNYAEKHREKGNGFGFGLVYPDSVSRTLSARYYKDGSEILVFQGENKNPRRLTPRECARLMGFSDDHLIPVSDTRAYKQFGNSVVVDVMHHVALLMKPFLK